MSARKLHPADEVRQLTMITIRASELIGALSGTKFDMEYYRCAIEDLLETANSRIRRLEEENKEGV